MQKYAIYYTISKIRDKNYKNFNTNTKYKSDKELFFTVKVRFFLIQKNYKLLRLNKY